MSYPFDDFLAEKAVRLDHQDQDHQHIGCKVLGSAANERIQVAGRLDASEDISTEATTCFSCAFIFAFSRLPQAGSTEG